jgi:hypothetical protein
MVLRISSREINRSHPTITHTDNLPQMVFPDPYPPPPPQALLPLPDPPKEDHTMAQWPQATEYVQPEHVNGINFDFESLGALFAWEQGSGTLPEPTPDFQPGHDLVSMFIPVPKEATNMYHRVSDRPP